MLIYNRRKQTWAKTVTIRDATNFNIVEIQFAYSLIRLEDIPAFFEMILKGIPSSKQVKEEVAQGVKTSSCVTVFVPTGQKDGTCNIIIDRNTLMEAITKFQLSDVML